MPVFNKDEKITRQYYEQALELLKIQAEKGDEEAYALWGETLYWYHWYYSYNDDIADGGEIYTQIVQLHQKAIDLGYADAYEKLGILVGRDSRKDACIYFEKGAKLGSGRCALMLSKIGSECLFYSSEIGLQSRYPNDNDDCKLMATQAMSVMDKLGEHIKLLKFVALTCRHYVVLPELLIHLSTAEKISRQVGRGIEEVERYKGCLSTDYQKIAQHFMQSRFAISLAKSGYLKDDEAMGLWMDGGASYLKRMRAFQNPCVGKRGEIDSDGNFSYLE
ncbi:SEL1-like repeat protein [Helicobacter vulpis]|uniref:hypothetical protein n=1 Tax=Helicobacter vulpis TaxID=2316076 RepID=UPI000EAD4FB1|nr:hypothetical protein [Helicobacter vulpis]